ncbi:MAG: hypothetical protein ABR600_11745 [Actinomycetota bacterium]
MTQCPACGEQVPEGTFCVRCGTRLAEGGAAKRGFSAAPNEGLRRPSVISSLFPQLPRASMATFRAALLMGLGVVLVLALLRLYPLAVVTSAVLVPLLTALYVYDVDVYEDEPIRVIAFTMLWGAATGILVGILARVLSPSIDALAGVTGSILWVRGILVPALAVVAMLVGPLVLLPYRKFNDVLDGATFGACCAVSFAGALLLTQAFDFFGGGFRPQGAITPWLVRLLELAVEVPVLYAALIGATAGAFWLRYRAPARDRTALGPLGVPAVAVVVAAALVVVTAIGQLYLANWAALVVYGIVAIGALIWLRQVIHIGLLQEASEIPIGPEIVCANCGATTARHSFCSNCGISLLALPKRMEAAQGEGA